MAAVVATQAKADKSVMSRLGPLTPAQRQDYLALVAGGIDPKTARAIVQSGVTKALDGDKPRPTYHHAYVAHAKKTLPTWQHDQLHTQARAIAGGHASATARNAPDPMDANKQELALLKDRMGYLEQEIAKGSMLASEVHVPVPLGSDDRKKEPVMMSAEDAMVAEAYDIVAKASFDEQSHPRADNGEFSSGGGGGGSKGDKSGDVPFANPKDVKEVKPKKPRQKPVPYADPKDVHEVKPRGSASKKPAANQDSEKQGQADAARTALAAKAQQIGTTQSGKAVYAGVKANHKATADFTRQDHLDAVAAHNEASKRGMHVAEAGQGTPVTQKQSLDAQASHGRAVMRADSEGANAASDARAAQNSLGTTASGKHIYTDTAAGHRRYKGYSPQDHLEASRAHLAQAKAAADKGDGYWQARHLSMAKGHANQASKPVRKAASSAEELAHIQAAYELTSPAQAYNPDQDKVPAGAEELIQANRLVAGMDAEMAAGAASPEDARKRASRALKDRPGIYDSVGATPQTDRLDGLMLDLGAGSARAPGFIGLDLGTFGDYGNAIHDCTLGLGEFPDGSVRAVRLVNALHAIVDNDTQDGDPTYLLQEIQRVLCEGGILTYIGPEPLFESDDAWPAPGLFLMGEQGIGASDAPDGAGAVWQTFERVPPRVPAYHGADADYAPAGPMPIDMALAMAAYNEAPARLAMANLVHKCASRVVKIAKTDAAKQIVYGVVLDGSGAPDLQGDVMTHDDIEEAAHGYLGTSRVIGSEHGAPIEAHPVESFIAPQDLTFDGPGGRSLVAKGSWVLGVKITDPTQWAQARDGGYNAFSVGGYGLRDDL